MCGLAGAGEAWQDAGRLAHNGDVNVVVVEVRRGRDGKLYPPRMPLPPEELARVRSLAHKLRCAGDLSIRGVQKAMLEEHGVRRSVGQVWNDLTRYECERCRD